MSNQFKFKQNEVEILFKNSKYIYKNNFLLIKKSLYNVENPKFLIVFVKNFGIACYRNYLRRCIKDILLKINFYNKKNSYVFIFKKNNWKKNLLPRYKNFFIIFRSINKFSKFIIISLILFIRSLFFIKNCCKYNITCTEYAKIVIDDEKNIFRASFLITKRFIFCGYDFFLLIILIYFISIFFL